MPILYVIAGPNGIGKTTSTYDLLPANIPVVNSDEIAKEIRISGILPQKINTQEYSNNEANRLIQSYLKKQNPFAFETNLADQTTWKFLIETQKTGYKLHIIYVSTSDLGILNQRIEARVQQGDHYVRPDIVKERYLNGLNLLNHYFKIPDHLQLFDNTHTATLVAEVELGNIVKQADSLPEWVAKYLGQHFQKEQNQPKPITDLSIEEIRKNYKDSNKK